MAHLMAISTVQQLGSLEITALLGKGGMGKVYRARDTKLKRMWLSKSLATPTPALRSGPDDTGDHQHQTHDPEGEASHHDNDQHHTPLPLMNRFHCPQPRRNAQ